MTGPLNGGIWDQKHPKSLLYLYKKKTLLPAWTGSDVIISLRSSKAIEAAKEDLLFDRL